MNVLILGSGGREHTFAWKIKQSKKVKNIFIAPGNGGTSECGTNIEANLSDFSQIKKICIDSKINMVVVGPEAPLVDGITDYFETESDLQHIHIIGPRKAGALLEGSKAFAKEFMLEFNIPTARYGAFTKKTLKQGCTFLDQLNSPYVLKADGLAAGKGVLIIENKDEAKEELANMLNGKFGKAGSTVVIEEFLTGIEVSYFCYTNGTDYIMLPEAKDYKRIGEGDTGLNTGGMGSISPVSFANKSFENKVISQIVEPTIAGLKSRNINYHGFIFFGLINVENNPYVIEYNVRLGDPETESMLPRIKTDLMEMFEAGIENKLKDFKLEITNKHAVSVMLVAGGYPESYEKGDEITIPKETNCIILHAGTKKENKKIVTNGGRVMAITHLGETLGNALSAAMKTAEEVEFNNKYYRKDLGFDLK